VPSLPDRRTFLRPSRRHPIRRDCSSCSDEVRNGAARRSRLTVARILEAHKQAHKLVRFRAPRCGDSVFGEGSCEHALGGFKSRLPDQLAWLSRSSPSGRNGGGRWPRR
jgi:hypothetical protein